MTLTGAFAAVDMGTILDVYDTAAVGLLDVEDTVARLRRSYLNSLCSDAQGPPSAIAGVPVAPAALLAFTGRASATVAETEWSAGALASVGIGAVDVAAAVDEVLSSGLAATRSRARRELSLLPMASFRSTQSDYRVVDVADLPNFHSPDPACRLREFDERLRVLSRRDRFRSLFRFRTVPESARARAGAWLESAVRTGSVLPCNLHVLSPSEVRDGVDLAIEVWSTVRPWSRRAAYVAVNPSLAEPPDPVAHFAWSLLARPIDWTTGAPYLGNGQHRTCALREAGVRQVLVIG